jgi:hypothetical protein
MKVNVEVTAKDIAAAMEADADFGAEVLTAFLQGLGRFPDEFARTASFRQCEVLTANQLRALAAAIEAR